MKLFVLWKHHNYSLLRNTFVKTEFHGGHLWLLVTIFDFILAQTFFWKYHEGKPVPSFQISTILPLLAITQELTIRLSIIYVFFLYISTIYFPQSIMFLYFDINISLLTMWHKIIQFIPILKYYTMPNKK